MPRRGSHLLHGSSRTEGINVNFTREPLIETVITAKEGYKLALRNSKGGGQEEFFVDALEVISFGNSCFYRSLEKPKSFLVPVTDYEIIEVREPRMVLKTGAVEKGGIKIAGGRETAMKAPREEKEEVVIETSEVESVDQPEEQKVEKKRERRRTRKRRKGEQERPETPPPVAVEKPIRQGEKPTLIPPPSTLISETINRYKEITIHETKEEEAPLKKAEEFFEGPSEDSSESTKGAQPQVEDDEEIPF